MHVCVQAKISEQSRGHDRMLLVTRYPDNQLRTSSRRFRSFLESHTILHDILKVVAILGICLMITGKIWASELQ
jgi:hypothetical protein